MHIHALYSFRLLNWNVWESTHAGHDPHRLLAQHFGIFIRGTPLELVTELGGLCSLSYRTSQLLRFIFQGKFQIADGVGTLMGYRAAARTCNNCTGKMSGVIDNASKFKHTYIQDIKSKRQDKTKQIKTKQNKQNKTTKQTNKQQTTHNKQQTSNNN